MQSLVLALDQLATFFEQQLSHQETGRPLDYPIPSNLALICERFGLSSFERDLLLLCASVELDARFRRLVSQAQGNSQKTQPTFSLALAILPNPHWNALTPVAPLRQWRLINLSNEISISNTSLSIDERILHYLTGVSYPDERLLGLVDSVDFCPQLVSSHELIAQQISDIWTQETEDSTPIIQLWGPDKTTLRAIASFSCQGLGLSLNSLAAELLPSDLEQVNLIRCLCEREWLLSQSVLLLDCYDFDSTDFVRQGIINCLVTRLQSPVIIIGREPSLNQERSLISFAVLPPTIAEQRQLWLKSLEDVRLDLSQEIEAILAHFSLNISTIAAISLQFKYLYVNHPDPKLLLWQTCRYQARPRLESLAQPVYASATWQDLILPEPEKEILREIAIHVRQRTHVYENWGFSLKSSRGLGISVLFAGASGTGKTLAAEVLSNELDLDVYRIDLSSVVSKYIGETEKNLRKIFDNAEGSGAILLFDEADALFGKRSEVKDSHDRYANLEVSYLLQRIETYRGLAILTTNLKDSLDQAFLRRIRFIVQFPFPDINQRMAIWQKVFPPQTPTNNLDFQKLARLNVAGGSISNIALKAAFLAANNQEAVQMKHILQAAKSEYLKLEKTLTDSEIKGWF